VTPPHSPQPSVLHVVVGHGLRNYFLNAVRSVRAVAPGDDLLVIDNASPSAELKHELQQLADQDDRVTVILRTANDVAQNRKVGSLYAAYAIAFQRAIEQKFDYLHLIQGDFQVLWWDSELIARSVEIFDSHPRCVNINTQMLSHDKVLAEELIPDKASGLLKMRRYGLTDTGLYHLGRWHGNSMEFGQTEQAHAKRYFAEGLEVISHPWPTDAPIPWPAVIRNGKQLGKEVWTRRPYLLRPLSPEDVAQVKHASDQVWLEDFCVPWGWVCAAPMWVTGLNSIDYWVLRYRDARKNGIGRVLPRLDTRGVDRGDRRRLVPVYRYRPSMVRLFVAAPAGEVARRLRAIGGR
jgi:hypothetical protein